MAYQYITYSIDYNQNPPIATVGIFKTENPTRIIEKIGTFEVTKNKTLNERRELAVANNLIAAYDAEQNSKKEQQTILDTKKAEYGDFIDLNLSKTP